MEELDPLPIVVGGIGILMVWGGITGQNPVARVKSILTRTGVQSAPSSSTPTATYTVVQSSSSLQRRDYLSA